MFRRGVPRVCCRHGRRGPFRLPVPPLAFSMQQGWLRVRCLVDERAAAGPGCLAGLATWHRYPPDPPSLGMQEAKAAGVALWTAGLEPPSLPTKEQVSVLTQPGRAWLCVALLCLAGRGGGAAPFLRPPAGVPALPLVVGQELDSGCRS